MNILDKRFKYVNAASTDIRKTFERARKEQQRKEKTNVCKLATAAGTRRKGTV